MTTFGSKAGARARAGLGALIAAGMTAGGAAAATYDADAIRLVDVTGSVTIVAGAVDRVEVNIEQGSAYHPVDAAVVDGVVVLTGERWKDDGDRNCCDNRITRQVDYAKDRRMERVAPVDEGFFAGYPRIEVVVPRDGDVVFEDARVLLTADSLDGRFELDSCYVYGEIGSYREAVVNVIDGSQLAMGNVDALFELDVSGAADVRAGDVAMADIDVAGPGDVILGRVDGMLDVSIAGSGDVRAVRLDGPLTVRIAGSGQTAVQGGRADPLKVVIDGSGGVLFDGVAGTADLRLSGSSKVRIGEAAGRIQKYGRGDVYVGGLKRDDL